MSPTAPADVKQARKPRKCVSGASASQEQFALFETIWTEYLDAADRMSDLSLQTWIARNCYKSSLNELDANGLLSLTVRLINATSKARLLQAGELFYDCSKRQKSDTSSL